MKSRFFLAKKALVIALGLALSLGLTISARRGALAQGSLPDLTATIQAIDGAGQPIAKGQTVTYAGPQKHFIRLIVTNNGGGKALNFKCSMYVKKNLVDVFTPPGDTVTLGPGQSKVFDAQVNLTAGTNNIAVRLLSDPFNSIQESNEKNNNASFGYTAIVEPLTQ